MFTVSFTCQTSEEAALILRAVRAHRSVIRKRGDDPRNYAPAIPGQAAGFGWDTVDRVTLGMGEGTVTHMSSRIAGALRDALTSYGAHTEDIGDRAAALGLIYRLNTLIYPDTES